MKIKHCQVPLTEQKIKKLKKVTGEKHIKDALTKAVNYYIKEMGKKSAEAKNQ
jgi:hypothetical protein